MQPPRPSSGKIINQAVQEYLNRGRKTREYEITAMALLIISLFIIASGVALMGVAQMPSFLTSGMTGFFCYFAGAHLLFIGLGLLVTSVFFAALGACHRSQSCMVAAPTLSSRACKVV